MSQNTINLANTYHLEYKRASRRVVPHWNWMYRARAGCLKNISFAHLELRANQKLDWLSQQEEACLILLRGQCAVHERHSDRLLAKLGPRRSVFQTKASAFYIPVQCDVRLQALQDCELALCTAPASLKTAPYAIKPRDVSVRRVGQGAYRRQVHSVLQDTDQAQQLLVGETFTPAGHWSSYPPHKHDQDEMPQESKHEELYFFKMQPQDGFAIQRLFTANERFNHTFAVKHHETILIPKGYHPVAAPPHTDVYYLWVLSGRKRKLCMAQHPAY